MHFKISRKQTVSGMMRKRTPEGEKNKQDNRDLASHGFTSHGEDEVHRNSALSRCPLPAGISRPAAETMGRNALLRSDIVTYNPDSFNCGIVNNTVRAPLHRKISAANPPMHGRHAPETPCGVEGTDSSLVSKLVKRLAQLERSATENKEQLIAQERELMELRQYKKLHQMVTISKGGVTMDVSEAMKRLRERNEDLQNQIWDMEEFLQDYGLIWKGDVADKRKSDDEPFCFDLNTFLSKLEQLNALAKPQDCSIFEPLGEGKVKTMRTKPENEVSIAVFKNGLLIGKGPLRPFPHPAARSFVLDVLDGYFPSEFQHRYPDGVFFVITNRTTEMAPENCIMPKFKPFTGTGHHFTGEKANKETVPIADLCQTLPRSVVNKDGQVVPVRQKMQDLLQPKLAGARRIELCGFASQCPVECKDGIATKSDTGEVTWLRIKTEECVIHLHLSSSARIADVKGLIAKHVTSGFQLRSAFPRRLFIDDEKKLLDEGLVPSATLLVRKLSPLSTEII